MRIISKSFKREFVDKILSGEKCQTCRPTPKRMPVPGDLMRAFVWEDKSYRSKQKTIGYYVITSVTRIFISPENHIILVDDSDLLVGDDLEKFAIADGFRDRYVFFGFFAHKYGFKDFRGIVIKWRSLDLEAECNELESRLKRVLRVN